MARAKIGVVGIGMVGTQVARWFGEVQKYRSGSTLFLYDSDPAKNCNDDVSAADIIFLCLPTPGLPHGACDVRCLIDTVPRIKGEKIIVIKSTVPPGTTENLQYANPQHKLLFNPEFLREKTAWEDFCNPDSQIVGFTEKSRDVAFDIMLFLPRAKFTSPAISVR